MRYTEAEFEQLIRDRVNEQLRTRNKAWNPQRAGSGEWENFGEFALEVMKAARNPRETDSRLVKAAGSPSSNEYTPDSMGYIVPTDFMAELLEVAVEESSLLNKCMIVPMAKSSINIPCFQAMDRSGSTLYGGLTAQWIQEEGTIAPPVRPRIGQIGLRLRKLATLAYVSNELIEDSPISIDPLFRRIFSTTIKWMLADAVLNGTGAGMPLGVLQSPALITVSAESGQTENTILYENVVNLYSRLWDKSAGVWFANHSILPQLMTMSLAVGTGGIPVWIPQSGASGKPYNTLLGLPLEFTEHCPALGTKGDLLLLDMSQYVLGQKSTGPRIDTSAHIAFLNDQLAYRIVMRLDGQGWWSSPLTPKNGPTLSPFIALESRS